jgi:hypothetical protein
MLPLQLEFVGREAIALLVILFEIERHLKMELDSARN